MWHQKYKYLSWIMILKISVNITRIFFLIILSLTSLICSLSFLSLRFTIAIEWEFITLNSSIIEFTIIFDWISTLFLSFVCLISAIILLYREQYILGDKNLDRFIFLVLAFVLSIGALICRPNIIRILLGWDGLGLTSYVLVIYYQNEKSANAGILTVLSNRIGDVAILLRIALISTLGSWNFIIYAPILSDSSAPIKFLIILAAITKSAQIPFSAWLPAAIAAPTPVSALVHSSTLVTAGVFLLIRFRPALVDNSTRFFLLIFSTLTIFIARLRANFEYDLKKIIALSTLRQLGVIISILALGFPVLAFFHLLTHALFKALLFICAGVIIHNIKNFQDIRSIGNLAKTIPLSIINLNVANLALCGTPFLAGFYSKDLILETAFINNINIIVFFLYTFSTGLTVCYTFRLIFIRLTGSFNVGTIRNISDSAHIITSPIIPLGIGAIFSGSLLAWLLIPEPIIICLNPLFKALVLVISTLGALFGYIINIINTNYILKSLVLFPIVTLSGSIWFIPSLSTNPISLPILESASILQTSIDKGWSEQLGGQGIFSLIIFNRNRLQTLQDSRIKLYIKSFFLWIIITFLLTILTYLYNSNKNNALKLQKWSRSINIFRNTISTPQRKCEMLIYTIKTKNTDVIFYPKKS